MARLGAFVEKHMFLKEMAERQKQLSIPVRES